MHKRMNRWSRTFLMVVGMLAGIFALRAPFMVQAAPQEEEDQSRPQVANVLLLPYVAVGGWPQKWHFLTVLSLENPSNRAASGAFEFFTNEGAPLHVQLNDNSATASQGEWTLEPKQSNILVLTHPGDDYQAGWLRVEVNRNIPVEVIVVVQFYNGENLIGQAGAKAAAGDRTPVSYKMISAAMAGDWLSALPLLRNPMNQPWGEFPPPQSKRALAPPPEGAEGMRVTTVAQTELGLASWYGVPYHGRKAANGRIYDQNKLTAAHRTLPFGTRARITNLRNNRSVTVRITDRGPFVGGRIVDLSLAAARQLRMVKSGVSPVALEILPS